MIVCRAKSRQGHFKQRFLGQALFIRTSLAGSSPAFCDLGHESLEYKCHLWIKIIQPDDVIAITFASQPAYRRFAIGNLPRYLLTTPLPSMIVKTRSQPASVTVSFAPPGQ